MVENEHLEIGGVYACEQMEGEEILLAYDQPVTALPGPLSKKWAELIEGDCKFVAVRMINCEERGRRWCLQGQWQFTRTKREHV